MTVPTERNATSRSRRAALAKARQSRRPSRLGEPAGAAPKPDRVLGDDAGFPGLLARVWQEATAAPDLSSAVNTLLTLDGHVPADVQLRALRVAEDCNHDYLALQTSAGTPELCRSGTMPGAMEKVR